MEKEGEDFMNEGNPTSREVTPYKRTPSTPWSFEEVRALRWCSNPSNECSSGSKRLRVHWTDTRPCTASCGVQTVPVPALSWEDLRPTVARLVDALAAAETGTAHLRSSLQETACQLDAALALVADIPALAARCSELEDYDAECTLLARCSDNAAVSLGRCCTPDTALDDVARSPHNAKPPASVTLAPEDTLEALRTRLATTERELLHQTQISAELELQVNIAPLLCVHLGFFIPRPATNS